MSDTVEELRNKFGKWNDGFESKSLKVNLGKTKVMACGGITKDGMSKSKADPDDGICSLGVKANSILCLRCGMWIHGVCAEVKTVTPVFKKSCLQEM